MRLKLSEFLGAVVVLSVAIGAAAIVLLSLASCDAEPEQTWPESAEFSQIGELETGQDRWSVHDTDAEIRGARSVCVLVDHLTGCEYLMVWARGGGLSVCPLLGADGEPLRVAEAG